MSLEYDPGTQGWNLVQSSLRIQSSNYPSVCLWVLSGGSGFPPPQPGHETLKAPGG